MAGTNGRLPGKVEVVARKRDDGSAFTVYRVRWYHPDDVTADGSPRRYSFSALADVADGDHFRGYLISAGCHVRPSDDAITSGGWRHGLTGGRKAGRGVTLGVFALQAIEAKKNNSESTKEEKRAVLRNHFAGLLDKPVDQITNADCWALWHELEKKPHPKKRGATLSPRTVIGYMWQLSAILYDAKDARLINVHPFEDTCEPRSKKLELPRTDRVPSHTYADPSVDDAATENLSPEHYNAILRAAKYIDYQQFVMVTLILKTGLRIGECLALQVRHLSLGDDPMVHVTQAITRDRRGAQTIGAPKKGTAFEMAESDRRIPLDPAMVELLTEYLGTDASQGSRFVFPRPRAIRGNAGWSYTNWLTSRWYKIVARARATGELPPEIQPTPHKLRHTFAAQMLRRGVTMYDLSVLMGHRNAQTTAKRYAHFCKDDANAAARKAMAGI